jgi:hypothetical protein
MSNALVEYCEAFHLCPVKALNLLQEWNLVSDLCVNLGEVAPCDCTESIPFLNFNARDLKP